MIFPLNLTKLKNLDLQNASLRTFPPEILSLTDLEIIKMSINKITKIPDDIDNLKKLKTLESY